MKNVNYQKVPTCISKILAMKKFFLYKEAYSGDYLLYVLACILVNKTISTLTSSKSNYNMHYSYPHITIIPSLSDVVSDENHS
jgi:hypothetical protein